ncbi:thermostable hemolysin [Motilimonas cestriensis]|uniref:thermostable hemolysin n=1 Tax=Motilimonas cestriensis TaxID=2742685 RepID=UPI003DA48825
MKLTTSRYDAELAYSERLSAERPCSELSRENAVHPEILLLLNEDNRDCVRRFIQYRFYQAYGAKVADFLPHLLALVDRETNIKASLGFAPASQRPLFLEQYLSQPVELCIADALGVMPPKREQIVEMGNLASDSYGATRRLILNLAGYFLQQGYRWLTITATSQVRNSFSQLGLNPYSHLLADAKISALTKPTSDWGSYYEFEPQVLVIDIVAGVASLMANPLLNKLLQQINNPITDVMADLHCQWGEVC